MTEKRQQLLEELYQAVERYARTQDAVSRILQQIDDPCNVEDALLAAPLDQNKAAWDEILFILEELDQNGT